VYKIKYKMDHLLFQLITITESILAVNKLQLQNYKVNFKPFTVIG